MTKEFLQQLTSQMDALIEEYKQFRSKSQNRGLSETIDNVLVHQLKTRAIAVIERVTGKKSVYSEQARNIQQEKHKVFSQLVALIGIVEAVNHDLKAGYLQNLEELIHGNIFSDFLEMADHLSQNGYKDAAAVIAGSTLEAHLKQLSLKFGVPVDNNGKPKKADLLNSDLVKASAYSKLDQKSITAWLDLRNKAAHGDYTAYDTQQVNLLISSI
jgi:hypothetical protein